MKDYSRRNCPLLLAHVRGAVHRYRMIYGFFGETARLMTRATSYFDYHRRDIMTRCLADKSNVVVESVL